MSKTPFLDRYYWSINDDIRKHHFYRGMRAGILVMVPAVAILMYAVHVLTNLI